MEEGKGDKGDGDGKWRGGRERGGQRGQRQKTKPMSWECANVWDSLRAGRSRLDSSPITSVTDITVD